MRKKLLIGAGLAVGLLGVAIANRLVGGGDEDRQRGGRRAPVEVEAVERGPIALRRSFAGSLEARSRFVVAADVAGRVQRLLVDLSDPVARGQVVAELDDEEEVQSVKEAAAELAVARATVADAESGLEIAQRELGRLEALEGQGLSSQSDLDVARSQHLARKTAVKVAGAQLQRTTAALERARVRSGYNKVIAAWSGKGDERVVAQRHVNEGDTVAIGQPLLTVVDLDPMNAVVYVSEGEYGRLHADQAATVTTDAHRGRSFTATIRRVAPVFAEASRQARIEVEVANADGALRPGMFVRVEVVLERVDQATIVPVNALATRAGGKGVFVVDPAGETVSWHPVEVGIREGERVAVRGEGISGRVVTLGHQLVDDGSAITIPQRKRTGHERESR